MVVSEANAPERVLAAYALMELLKERPELLENVELIWVGLYGQLWIGAMEFWADLAHELMRLKRGKVPYFQQGLRAMALIQSTL